MATAVGDLVVKLGAQTGQFDKKMRGATGGVRRLGGVVGGLSRRLIGLGLTAAGVGSVAGLGIVIKRNLEMIDSAGKLSDRLGITTERLQGLRHAAELTGAGADTLDAGLTTMAKRLGEAARGAGAAKPALEQIGIKIEDILALSPDQQFIAIAEAISRLETHTERAAAAANIFSKGNMNLVNTLALGRAGMEAAQLEAERLGKTFGKDAAGGAAAAVDAIYRLQTATSAFGMQATIDLAPFVTILAEDLTSALVNGGKHTRTMAGDFGALGTTILLATEKLQDFQSNLISLQIVFLKSLKWNEEWKESMYGWALGPNEDLENVNYVLGQLERKLQRIEGSDWAGDLAKRVKAARAAAGASPLQMGGAPLDMADAADAMAATTSREATLGKMREEAFRLAHGLSDAQAALREFSLTPGVSPAQIDQFKGLQKEIAATKKATELWDAGKRLTEQMRTPMEQLRDELSRIQGLLTAGTISRQTAMRAIDQQRQQLRGPETDGAAGPMFSGAAEKGSAEAWTRIMNAMGQSRKSPEEKTAKNSDKMVTLLDRSTMALERIEDRDIDLTEIPPS